MDNPDFFVRYLDDYMEDIESDDGDGYGESDDGDAISLMTMQMVG